jgi:hypothetical protein
MMDTIIYVATEARKLVREQRARVLSYLKANETETWGIDGMIFGGRASRNASRGLKSRFTFRLDSVNFKATLMPKNQTDVHKNAVNGGIEAAVKAWIDFQGVRAPQMNNVNFFERLFLRYLMETLSTRFFPFFQHYYLFECFKDELEKYGRISTAPRQKDVDDIINKMVSNSLAYFMQKFPGKGRRRHFAPLLKKILAFDNNSATQYDKSKLLYSDSELAAMDGAPYPENAVIRDLSAAQRKKKGGNVFYHYRKEEPVIVNIPQTQCVVLPCKTDLSVDSSVTCDPRVGNGIGNGNESDASTVTVDASIGKHISATNIVLPSTNKKKRGRPKKSDTFVLPKKRGRPPKKRKTAGTPTNQSNLQSKRKRGRPRKTAPNPPPSPDAFKTSLCESTESKEDDTIYNV